MVIIGSDVVSIGSDVVSIGSDVVSIGSDVVISGMSGVSVPEGSDGNIKNGFFGRLVKSVTGCIGGGTDAVGHGNRPVLDCGSLPGSQHGSEVELPRINFVVVA